MNSLCVASQPFTQLLSEAFLPPRLPVTKPTWGLGSEALGFFLICASVLTITLNIWNSAILGVISELGANLKQHPTGSWHRLQCTKEIKAVQHVLISRGNSLLSRTSAGTLSPLFQHQEPFGVALEHHLYIMQPHICGGQRWCTIKIVGFFSPAVPKTC